MLALPYVFKTIIIKEITMLTWALTFFFIAILAAIFGFTGIAGGATGIAEILFFIFLVLFVLSLIVPRMKPPAN